MGIKINFDENFDNEILNKINEKYSIWDTNDNSKDNIIINLNEFNFFKNELDIFLKLKIIDRQTNILNIVRYNIFRKFIKKETIDWISWDDIRKEIKELEKIHNDYKLVLYLLSQYGFEENKITQNQDYQFYNNNELQIFTLLLIYWKGLFNKINERNNENINFNTQNWEVYQNWNLLWVITLNTMEYKFFNYLYKNKWIAKTHQEIFDEIKKDRTEKLINNYLTDVKRRLPEEIRVIIKAPKGQYLLP